MEEPQVGITEYTTGTSGFRGILKHRYEDFLVFEVDARGRTAHLTTLDPPQSTGPDAQLTEESVAEVTAAFKEIAGQNNADRLSGLLQSIRTYQRQQGDASAAGTAGAAAVGSEQLLAHLLPMKDKETRKAVHTFLKTDPRLPPLQTDTVSSASGPAAADAAAEAAADAGAGAPEAARQQEPDEAAAAAGADEQEDKQKEAEALNIVRVRFCAADTTGRKQKQEQRKGKNQRGWRYDAWPGGEAKFVKFVLLKENMDTQAALTVVSRMLRLHSHAFGFAGTKDRRGVTTQYVTLFKVDPAKLSGLNPRLRGIKLGNFEFCAGPLQLGQLRGNAFRILMRDVDTQDEAHIASAVAEVRQTGFINYFGLQRFGTGNIPTHRIGAALLRGEWQGAVELILQGTSNDKDDVRAARDKYVKAGDIKGALDAMPSWMTAERAILQVLLQQGPSAYTAALQAVPRTLRSMYMHAWQSWCWNTAASERIRRYGADSVVAGDLVLPPSAPAAAAAAVAAGAAEGEPEGAADGADAAAAAAAGEDADTTSASSRLAAVHLVTAEQAEQGVFSVTDVVLPLPGGQVQYPQHAAGWELYCRLAATDGILLPGETAAEYAAAVAAAAAAAAPGDAAAGGAAADAQPSTAAAPAAAEVPRQHGLKEFQLACLTGDYRRVLHVPSGLQHMVVRYSDPNQTDLLSNDLTALQLQLQLQQQQQGQQQGQRQQKRGRQEQQQQPNGQQQPDGGDSKRQKLGAEQQEETHQQGEGHDTQGGGQAAQPMEVEQASRGTVGQQPMSEAAAAAGGTANGSSAAGPAAGSSPAAAAAAGSAQQQQRERVGVILEFSLPSSCYATMLIRELTKTSTSKAAHKSLSSKQP